MENTLLHKSSLEAFEYFGIPKESQIELIGKLTEEHRFYHNFNHINDLINLIENYDASKYNYNLTSVERKILLAVALYHDAIYNPMLKDNEEKSAEYFLNHCTKSNRSDETHQVTTIIKETSNHIASTKLSQIFCDFDLSGLKEGSFYRILSDEKKIFLEFQKHDYSDYKKGRIDFLESFIKKTNGANESNIKALIDYVKFRVPKIGIFAGSFDPFHKGHLSILEKAEKTFDKVIVAKGINPEKIVSSTSNGLDNLDKKLYYRQVEAFLGLITDFISEKSKDANITLIRGLRNGNDLNYETNQIKFINEFDPTVKSIFIHCDKEYEHISSTAIRNMLMSGNEKMIEKAKSYL